MLQKKLIFCFLLFFIIYALFWVKFLDRPKKINIISPSSKVLGNLSKKEYPLQKESLKETAKINTGNIYKLPESYKIILTPRTQAFNLSCEFAAASAILYHFTNNPDFSIQNKKQAEEILMEKVGLSQNPNIGIRMGKELPEGLQALYVNLNQFFGGGDYYGVHAPPFIDVFANYNLAAKAIDKDNDLISSIQRALYSGHLIMAWMKIGYSKQIDVELSYGITSIVKGEHTVVLTGYDKNGLFFMDPAIGQERYASYKTFLDSINSFAMPLLEVYPSLGLSSPLETALFADKATGMNRSLLKIAIKNGSKKVGAATKMELILKDFGYNIIEIGNADNFDYEDVTIKIKKNMKDYLFLLKKDLTVVSYYIASISADLSQEEKPDAIIVVGL